MDSADEGQDTQRLSPRLFAVAEEYMARMVLPMLVLVCSIAAGARAQCCGDCNGDGAVSINELITAVNNALFGCGAATPTPGHGTPTHKPTATPTPAPRCTLSFTNQNNNGVCDFQGTYNRSCGSALNSVLSTNGLGQGCDPRLSPPFVVVILATQVQPQPFVYFSAHVESATSATLCAWSIDAFQTSNHPTSGVLQLNNGGTQLEIFPDTSPFTIGTDFCAFVQYLGAYTGNSITSPQQVSRAESGAESGVRLWSAEGVPNLSAP
jgi:hypothetical protein